VRGPHDAVLARILPEQRQTILRERFLVLATNGVAHDNLAWKDMVVVPVGGSVDLLLELSNPGRWMLHCHIAEHLEAGMQMVFTVEP